MTADTRSSGGSTRPLGSACGQAIREIDGSGGAISGRGLATAGRILGFIIIIIAITVIGALAWLVIVLFADASDTTSSLGVLAG